MKRIFTLLCAAFFCLAMTSCNPGKTKNADISMEDSAKFSKKEIQAAVDCVIWKFKSFGGCELTKLWYDEERSDEIVESYMKNGRGSINGVKAENVIVLLSDFTVDSTGATGGFNPNSTCTSWNWILIRSGKTGRWKVDDWGIE